MKEPAAHDAKQNRTIKIFALSVIIRSRFYRTPLLQIFS
jgi:hypothetical protein